MQILLCYTVVVFNHSPLSTPQSVHKLKTNALEGFLETQAENQCNKKYNHFKRYLSDTCYAWAGAGDSSSSHIGTLQALLREHTDFSQITVF